MKQMTSSSQGEDMSKSWKNHGQSAGGVVSFEELHITAAPLEEATTSNAITDKLQNNLLISAHVKAVRHLSKTVFGKRGILDGKIEEILEDTSNGEELLRELSLSPEQIHKFAGVSVCGLRNKARKNAIEGLVPLCSAINGLIEAAKRTQNGDMFEIGQSSRKQSTEEAETVEDLPKPYKCSQKKTDSLTDNEVFVLLKNNPFVQECMTEIEYLCVKVYGCSNALARQMDAIQRNPAITPSLLQYLANRPWCFHKLAGIDMCGMKNETRREAELSVQHLCERITYFSEVVKFARELVIAEHREQQEQVDRTQNQTQEAVAQNIHHTRAKHHPTPQQERSPRAESKGMAFAL